MDEVAGVPRSNVTLVGAPVRVRVVAPVGGRRAKAVLIIQRGGRAFRRCQACGRLLRVDPDRRPS
jgi:hypothetical protein